MTTLTRFVCVVVLLTAAAAAAQPSFADREAIVQFQRAADLYAFAHRQADRRGSQAPVIEGAMITPTVAAAFRARIRVARSHADCQLQPATDLEVPRVNTSTQGSGVLPACVAALLPPLPPELEYRTAGVALILGDAHLHIVVDILHAAFP